MFINVVVKKDLGFFLKKAFAKIKEVLGVE